jgi:hypothetical protein
LVSADMLNDRVLPFYEEQSVPLLRILTDRGTKSALELRLRSALSSALVLLSLSQLHPGPVL